jgi:hypothetical protein
MGGLGKTREETGKGLPLSGGLWGVGGGAPGRFRADAVGGGFWWRGGEAP